jgi:copper homeostasis protein CutC
VIPPVFDTTQHNKGEESNPVRCSCLQGLPVLQQLLTQAAGRICILAGGGVTAANVGQLLAAGLQEVHSSAKG